ncbi:MAG: mannose-1-phosphate guanylyltransferase [Gemmatimonadaceae bacterium]
MSVWAVVLAGGIGSRFWPLSTRERPKQLLPLVTGEPLLGGALRRVVRLATPDRTIVLTNASLVEAVAAVALEYGVPRGNIIAEPKPAGTAAALAWAALEIQRRAGSGSPVMVSVHADWAIGNEAAFIAALGEAARIAVTAQKLVTVGVVPSRPDTGFGYIEPGAPAGGRAREVKRFVEKPDRDAARRMCAAGCLWNSGIFAWRVQDFLAEVRFHTRELDRALDVASREPADAAAFFAAAEPVSVDSGVLERSSRVLVLPGDFGWDDVGTWAALQRVLPLDDAGNAVRGNVHALESGRNVVHAENGAIVMYGVSDLVVVARDGLTLVTTVERAADLKRLVEWLPAELREPA